jgi:hypothetical protein
LKPSLQDGSRRTARSLFVAAAVSAFGAVVCAAMAIATLVVDHNLYGLAFVPGGLWFLWLTIGKLRHALRDERPTSRST